MMIGVIEHGPGEDVEAGVHCHEVDMRPLDHIDSREHDSAVRHYAPARLQNELREDSHIPAAILDYRQDGLCQIRGQGGSAVWLVLDAKASPQVYSFHIPALSHHCSGDVHHPSRCLGEGGGVQNLAADMAVQSYWLYPFELHRSLIGPGHLLRRDAEL